MQLAAFLRERIGATSDLFGVLAMILARFALLSSLDLSPTLELA
jgi:hypothetical protein